MADWYNSDYYTLSPTTYPTGPVTGEYRVVRDGSWRDNANFVRAAYRGANVPDGRYRLRRVSLRPLGRANKDPSSSHEHSCAANSDTPAIDANAVARRCCKCGHSKPAGRTKH